MTPAATLADETGDYAYGALQPEKRQIRLVTLVAGTEAIIKAKLSTVSLDDEPRFETLSYVWGDKNITLPIAIERHPFQVTENLEAALHSLRHPDIDRVLWIDSLCVNQNDFNTEGENAKSNALLALVKTLKAANLIDGVGFQSHFIVGEVPTDLQANLQRFADVGVDVAITELDIRVR